LSDRDKHDLRVTTIAKLAKPQIHSKSSDDPEHPNDLDNSGNDQFTIANSVPSEASQ
jgi:hypothetical protein